MDDSAEFLETLAARVRVLEARESVRSANALDALLGVGTPARGGSGEVSAPRVGAGPYFPELHIAAKSVTAEEIAAGSIHVSHMGGSPSNLCPNGDFEDITGVTVGGGLDTYTPGLRGWTGIQGYAGWLLRGDTFKYGSVSIQHVRPGNTTVGDVESLRVPVQGNRRMRLRVWYRGEAGNNAAAQVNMFVRAYKYDGTNASTAVPANSGNLTIGAGTTWTEYKTVFTPSSDTAFVLVGLRHTGTTGGTTDAVRFDSVELYYADDDVSHAAGNVLIDSTGVTISNGKLTIQDEFGVTAMDSGGFLGAWEDMALTAIRNGSFRNNLVANGITGRTASCPYWTLATVTGSPVFNSVVGRLDMVLATTASESGKITSDLIRVNQAADYRVRLVEENNAASNSITRTIKVRQYTSVGSLISTDTIATTSLLASSGGGPTPFVSDLFQTSYGPAGQCDFISIEVAATRGAGDTTYEIEEVTLTPEPRAEGLFFTPNPEVGARFWQTDVTLSTEFSFDGTRWNTTTRHVLPFLQMEVAPATADSTFQRAAAPPVGDGTDLNLKELATSFLVAGGGTALDASNKWVGTVKKVAGGTPTTIATITIASGSSSVWRQDLQTIDALLGLTNTEFEIAWDKTGTPGNLYAMSHLSYYLVAT